MRHLKQKKGAISLTTQSLYAIFVVIFVSFVAFASINSRTSSLQQQEFFGDYDRVNSLISAFLNSPCLVMDFIPENQEGPVPKNYIIETKAYLSVEKLNLQHNENKDIYCVDNYNFLYSLEVIDLFNEKRWNLGILGEPGWVSMSSTNTRVVSRSFPIAINYDFTEIHPGYATLVAYSGPIPKFYGAIKLACTTKATATIPLDQRLKINYSTSNANFCVGEECFFAYFPCRVEDFTLDPGYHQVVLDYDSDIHLLEVKT